jgi:biotin carboxyl carrier protein
VRINFEYNEQSFSIDLTPAGRSYQLAIGQDAFEAQILQAKDGRLDLLIDGRRVTAYVSNDNARRWVTINGRTLVLKKSAGGRRSAGSHHHAAGDLTAPMPGQIRAVNVDEGDTVSKGQTLLLLEAMKMEIRIQSPQNGVVRKLLVKQGQTVEREQMLIEVVDTP